MELPSRTLSDSAVLSWAPGPGEGSYPEQVPGGPTSELLRMCADVTLRRQCEERLLAVAPFCSPPTTVSSHVSLPFCRTAAQCARKDPAHAHVAVVSHTTPKPHLPSSRPPCCHPSPLTPAPHEHSIPTASHGVGSHPHPPCVPVSNTQLPHTLGAPQ